MDDMVRARRGWCLRLAHGAVCALLELVGLLAEAVDYPAQKSSLADSNDEPDIVPVLTFGTRIDGELVFIAIADEAEIVLVGGRIKLGKVPTSE